MEELKNYTHNYTHFYPHSGSYDFMLFVLQNNKSVTTAESRVFWLGLVICPLIWMFFLIAALFSLKFKWLVSCIDL